MVELLCSILPCVLYAGDSGVLFSVACGCSTTSASTVVGLICTLVERFGTLGTGASLCSLGDAVSVGMNQVVVVVAFVLVKISASCSKASIWPSICGKYPQK